MLDEIAGAPANLLIGSDKDRLIVNKRSASQRDTPEAIGKAASQFEALMIGQLMKSAREADGEGWLGTGEEDQAGSTLTELSEQQVSQVLASHGGLGLAKMISAGLSKAAHESAPPANSAETR